MDVVGLWGEGNVPSQIRSVYLVDVVTDSKGRRILKLDSISGGRLWKGIDYLIFNTWTWWNRTSTAVSISLSDIQYHN